MRENHAADEFERLAKQAVSCRYCFADLGMRSAPIDVAQPRYIGMGYWSAVPRVAVVTLNPAAGGTRNVRANERFRKLLHEFREGKSPLSLALDHQAEDMPAWGNGKFDRFYLAGLGLNRKKIAYLNIAWCATAGNKYPRHMLNACFERHTRALLCYLKPQIVLLSGSDTHAFSDTIGRSLPKANVIPMLHYAHREGAVAEARELTRVRTAILGVKKNAD